MRFLCFISSLGFFLGVTSACAAPVGTLQGRLTLDVASARLETRVLQDDYHPAQAPDNALHRLPAFSFAYIQDGTALLPLFCPTAGAIARSVTAGNMPLWPRSRNFVKLNPFAAETLNDDNA